MIEIVKKLVGHGDWRVIGAVERDRFGPLPYKRRDKLFFRFEEISSGYFDANRLKRDCGGWYETSKT